MISKIKNIIIQNNLDGYLVPKNDEYFTEYSNSSNLKLVSNFSGSAGFGLIMKNKNYLFVDGRYTLQAKKESGKNFHILEIPYIWPKNILNKLEKKQSIGFDPNFFTYSTLKRYFNNCCNLIPINKNIFHKIDNKILNHNNKFFLLNEQITGKNAKNKIKDVIKVLKRDKIDNIFISAGENVCWLLNIRGEDLPNSPVANSRLILDKNSKIYFFSDKNKISKIRKLRKKLNISFHEEKEFFEILNKIKKGSFCIDGQTCSIFNQELINSKFKIKKAVDPIYYFKSVKNKTEIKNMKNAHIEDGVALTKFLYWIKNKNIKKLNELSIERKLENFRKKNKNYLYPSFNTIAGSGPNGAIIHYRSSNLSNRNLKKDELLLVDSGGQYKWGTTDVTRTICFSNLSKNIKDVFTRVLKGHIAVALANINKEKNGHNIDKKARKSLNSIGLDYRHGTGHGVGFFLNVHEGPQSISKNNKIELKEGMILSNEPGFYKENKFGIRIENLVFIKKIKNKLVFQNLTLAPIDKDLINFETLTKLEKDYLFEYHLEVYLKISPYLNKNQKKWLAKLI
tara:strand:- start:19234 stop:20931 length:1698 start_codon:yes stop_codon:yes gene_type:complete